MIRPLRSLLGRLRRPRRRRDVIGRLRAIRTVLVVCRGNTCRSPYAARRLAESLPPRWEVRQGGIAASPGEPSPVEAIEAAAERGVDLSGHSSRAVTAADLESAGTVLVFDWGIRDDLAARYPEYADRVFLLGEVTPGPVEVPDPFGKPVERYRATYRDIDRKIQHLIAGLGRRD